MRSIALHIQNYPVFEWGKSDCIKFVADYFCIDTPHASKKEAIQLIKEHGSLDALVDEYLDRKDLAFCSRGDAVMVFDDDNGKALGICDGEFVLCNTKSGIVRVSMNKALMCWGKPCHK